MNAPMLSALEIADLWKQNKAMLLENLSRRLLETGVEYAMASAEYQANGGRYGKGEAFLQISARYHKLQIEYDVLGKAVSALQSVVRIERLGVYEGPQ